MTAASAWEEAGVVAAAAVEASGADGWGGEEDMIEQEESDTKVSGARVLPGLGRRL
jgi:Na+-translocating ferredoxin:NAD+ oxidoreductase RnfG subunit